MPILSTLGFRMNVIIVLRIKSFCANNSDMYSRSFVFIHFWQPLCVYSINAACISFCWEHRFSQRTTSWVRQVFTSSNDEMWHIEYYAAVTHQQEESRLRSRRAVHTSVQKRPYPYWILLRQAWLHFRKQTAGSMKASRVWRGKRRCLVDWWKPGHADRKQRQAICIALKQMFFNLSLLETGCLSEIGLRAELKHCT